MKKYYFAPEAEELNLLPGSDLLQIISTGDEWDVVDLGDI